MLYRQGTQRIEIIVRKDGGTAQNGAKETEAENVSADSSTNANQGANGGGASLRQRALRTNITHALRVAKQAVDVSLNYYVSGIGQRTGDQALQEITERTVEIAQDTTGIVYSVAMGAGLGAYGGPIGALVGGTMGAISSIMPTVYKYRGRERDFSYKVFKENNAIEYQRARASISLTTGRLR